MPLPRLGATDSFNSSGATIIPEKRRSLTQQTHPRGLYAQDSLERELNSALGVEPTVDDDAMMGVLHDQRTASGLGGLSFMREYTNMSQEDSQPQSYAQPQSQTHYQNTHPASTADFLEQIQADATNHVTHIDAPYRPTSAHSHHSHSPSIDASDYYSTTDMDTDDDVSAAGQRQNPGLAVNSHMGDLGMGGMALSIPITTIAPGGMPDWQAYSRNDNDSSNGDGTRRDKPDHPAVISPSSLSAPASAPGVSPSEFGSETSPSAFSTGQTPSVGHGRRRGGRVAAVLDDSEQARAERLEHRRDINRRSAQKHRVRRKEEIDVLNRRLAEKEAKIRQLEQDLAVEKARVQTLKTFVNSGMFAKEGAN